MATLKVEEQLKARKIPYQLVSSPTRPPPPPASSALRPQPAASPAEPDSLVPVISVKAADVLRNVPAATDVALPNLSMRVAGWWGPGPCQVSGPRRSSSTALPVVLTLSLTTQVVTSVKLRQQPTLSLEGGHQKNAPAASSSASARAPSSANVHIDSRSSIVSFRTENIEGCVDALTEEFSRVGKLAVIASESASARAPCPSDTTHG